MSKKVLVISASPRKKGNSDLLCDEFIKGAVTAGNEVEKVFLSDLKINYCTGCGVCNNTSRCVLTDDMKAVLDKMVAVDVIVLATPVYFYTMDAQLKTLIDRTVPRYTEIKNKEFYYIVAAADTKTAEYGKNDRRAAGLYAGLPGRNGRKRYYLWCRRLAKGEIRETAAFKQAYEMGTGV